MAGDIYLLGGGEIKDGETCKIDYYILDHAKKVGTIAFIGAASGDAVGYFEAVKEVYSRDGDETVFVTSDFSEDEFRDAIVGAKIVYIGGGVTERLMKKLKDWKAKEVFVEALENGTDLVGLSAGMYVLSEYYIHDEEDGFEVREGLGLVPVVALAHSTLEKEQRARGLIAGNEFERKKFVALPECEMMIA